MVSQAALQGEMRCWYRFLRKSSACHADGSCPTLWQFNSVLSTKLPLSYTQFVDLPTTSYNHGDVAGSKLSVDQRVATADKPLGGPFALYTIPMLRPQNFSTRPKANNVVQHFDLNMTWYHKPYALCMGSLPTFALKIIQMQVNIPYMEHPGNDCQVTEPSHPPFLPVPCCHPLS